MFSTVGLCDKMKPMFFLLFHCASYSSILAKKISQLAKPNQTNKNPEEVEFVKESEDHTSVRTLSFQDSTSGIYSGVDN